MVAPMTAYDVITTGRVGVDLYPQQIGVPLADVTTAITLPATAIAGSTVNGTVGFSNAGPSTAAGVTYTLIFHNVDPPGTTNPQHGFSGVSDLGLPSTDDISPGHDFQITGFTPQDYQRGSYPFVCTQNDCGGDPEQHNGMIGLLIIE